MLYIAVFSQKGFLEVPISVALAKSDAYVYNESRSAEKKEEIYDRLRNNVIDAQIA